MTAGRVGEAGGAGRAGRGGRAGGAGGAGGAGEAMVSVLGLPGLVCNPFEGSGCTLHGACTGRNLLRQTRPAKRHKHTRNVSIFGQIFGR